MRNVIASSQARFEEKMAAIDRKLAGEVPAKLAEKLKITDLFEQVIHKTDRKFKDTVKAITIAPEITPEQRRRIASEWTITWISG